MSMRAHDLGPVHHGAQAVQRLYRLEPPIVARDWDPKQAKAHAYVIASALVVNGEPETYLFPSDEEGRVIDFCALDGSYRGALNHEEAITGAGYTVVETSRMNKRNHLIRHLLLWMKWLLIFGLIWAVVLYGMALLLDAWITP